MTDGGEKVDDGNDAGHAESGRRFPLSSSTEDEDLRSTVTASSRWVSTKLAAIGEGA